MHYDIRAVDIFIDDTDGSGHSIHKNCSLATEQRHAYVIRTDKAGLGIVLSITNYVIFI